MNPLRDITHHRNMPPNWNPQLPMAPARSAGFDTDDQFPSENDQLNADLSIPRTGNNSMNAGRESVTSVSVADERSGLAAAAFVPGTRSKKPGKPCHPGMLCDADGAKAAEEPHKSNSFSYSASLKFGIPRVVVAYLPPGFRELPVLPTTGSRIKSSQFLHWLGLLALFSCASIWLLGPVLSFTPAPAATLPPRLILVTPTYTRAFQAAYFTQLTHTLRLVPPPITWIVVESGNKTEETAMLLERTAGYCVPVAAGECQRLEYIHMATENDEDQRWFRGVGQRNVALEYIEERSDLQGIVYFMDDDNTYSLPLFEELRKIRRIGVLPVGFLLPKDSPMRSYVGRPIVRFPADRAAESSGGAVANSSGSGSSGGSSKGDDTSLVGVKEESRPTYAVTAGDYEGGEEQKEEEEVRPRMVGWEAYGRRIPLQRDPESRRYITDMAGFAFSTEALRNGTVNGEKMPIRFRPTKRGFLETDFLEQLVTHEDDFELLADGCREVWVWHKHTEDLSWAKYPKDWRPKQSNYRIPTYDWVKNTGNTSHEERAGLIGRIARVANVTLPPGFEQVKAGAGVKRGAGGGGGVRVVSRTQADLSRERLSQRGSATRKDGRRRPGGAGIAEDGARRTQRAIRRDG